MADESEAPQYLAEAFTCLACEQREAAAKAAADDAGGRPQPGIYWAVRQR